MARYVRITGFPETSEDVFGMTIRGLLAQGVPSITEKAFPLLPYGRCMYRTIRDGVQVACAAGLWIPDKDYRADMEGSPFSSIAHRFGDKWARPFLSSGLTKMQEIHDHAARDWSRLSKGDWASILLQQARDIIFRMSSEMRAVLIPVHWEDFFVPE